jgi:hypothetical protein
MTWQGRLFVIFYALIGVPLAMIVIADAGKFIAILMRRLTKTMKRLFHKSYAIARFGLDATIVQVDKKVHKFIYSSNKICIF